jgi:hypothetical protein
LRRSYSPIHTFIVRIVRIYGTPSEIIWDNEQLLSSTPLFRAFKFALLATVNRRLDQQTADFSLSPAVFSVASRIYNKGYSSLNDIVCISGHGSPKAIHTANS